MGVEAERVEVCLHGSMTTGYFYGRGLVYVLVYWAKYIFDIHQTKDFSQGTKPSMDKFAP